MVKDLSSGKKKKKEKQLFYTTFSCFMSLIGKEYNGSQSTNKFK